MTPAAAPAVPAGPALVVLIGAAGSGKSTWAREHYQPQQIVSLDALRATVADDENDQAATADAVGVLHAILAARMSRRLTTVVDATNGVPTERAELLAHAVRHQVPAVAVVVDTPLPVCLQRQRARPGPAAGRRWGRAVPASVVTNQHARTQAATADVLLAEGFTTIVSATSYPTRTVRTESDRGTRTGPHPKEHDVTPPPARAAVTPAEGTLAQTYVETLDILGRCAKALATGDWQYLSDKTGQLRIRVEAFEQAADAAAAMPSTTQPREDVVIEEVVRRGSSYPAVKALHGPAITVPR